MRRELTLGEFYAADPRRAHSSEVGYGSLWREFAPVPTYRVEWIRATGELYAVELSQSDEAEDPVEVLGVLWSRPQVEACLAGWSERCGGQRSLLWVRERVRSWRPVTEESQLLQDRPTSPLARRVSSVPRARPPRRSGWDDAGAVGCGQAGSIGLSC